MDVIQNWLDWYKYDYKQETWDGRKEKKSKCPSCGKMSEFRFHFDIPPGPKECFPNECMTCGIFCNYLGEIYKKKLTS